MEAIIRFKNGDTITAEMNGNCFITPEEPVFPEDLSMVAIMADGQETLMEYVIVQPAAAVDNRFWFCFVEESPQDRMLRELEEKNRFLEDCLMEMSEEVYK